MGDAEEGEGEETGGLRWDRDRVRVSCAGEMLQKSDDDGENTGELQTATEQDIFFRLLMIVYLCVFVSVKCQREEKDS